MTSLPTLAQFTYMKTGGPVDEVVEVASIEELVQTIKDCRRHHRRFFVLGGGSNTIFTDAGFRGLLILNKATAISINPTTATIVAESGCPMNLLVNQSAAEGLSGLEWFLGLPGTVGGAIYNNSHFQTHFVGDVVASVLVLDAAGDQQIISAADCHFGYDTSRFHSSNEIILSATFKLAPDDPVAIQTRAKQSLDRRASTQPLSQPSSGCMFQNPPSGPSAGQLIDMAGLKGMRVGDAMVSHKHANFIVNLGHATTTDIAKLAQQVASIVKQKFGVDLQKEVFYINEFGERIDQ